MSKSKKIAPKDLSTEEKIKCSARKLFTQNGYAATGTREIAKEAGINLALLNYYFRSKRKLFELVMKENVYLFFGAIIEDINNNPRPFEKQLQFLISRYIDMLMENPDLPLFVLNILQSGKIPFENKDDPLIKSIQQMRGCFLKGIQEALEKGKVKTLHPFHVITNMMGLIIFPFIASSLLKSRSGNISSKEFERLMLERKRLIPKWIKAEMKVK